MNDVLARIEQRQSAFEIVAHRIVGMLEIHCEKLDAILAAATVEPGPSPTAEVLGQMLISIESQTALLQDLPAAIGHVVRQELEADWQLAEALAGRKTEDSSEESAEAGSRDEAGGGRP